MVKKLVQAKVVSINKTHLEVETKQGQHGFVHISQVSDYFVPNLESMFHIGERSWFVVISSSKASANIELGWKQLHPRFLKSPYQFEIKATPKGFHNLKRIAMKEVRSGQSQFKKRRKWASNPAVPEAS